MPEHYRDDAIVNPETQHEKTDVSVRALMVFIALFIVFAILTHVAIWLLFKGLAPFGTVNSSAAELVR